MTQPVDRALLKAEMGTLAKSYITMQACAIDSLILSADEGDVWYEVFQLSLTISDTIRVSLAKMVHVYHLLKDQL